MSQDLLIGTGETAHTLLARYANRHGLVAGATGTGKTITLQILAEGFSEIGVPVFAADVKGDLSGIAAPGVASPKLLERAAATGLPGWTPSANPVVFWDVFGNSGHPVRATVSELGPILLARLLELSDVQEAVLSLVFKYCDDQGLLLLDFKDLRAALNHVSANAKSLGADYGLVSTASVGAIQRGLIQLEADGAEHFFGEPALDLNDFLLCEPGGRGIVNVLAADVLYRKPRLYATFLLWLLSELFENLPEAGDLDKPKLVFFFDEAHLLFNDAPKALVEKVEQVVRLIRSKGVGVYFVTQNPLDLPESVLGQLGNRVQHALRAFTPRDQKAVKAAAETFRPNPRFKTAEAIMELGVGEALVSTLQDGGVPAVVDRVKIRPPRSRMGALSAEERALCLQHSPFAGKYDQVQDRESAYELLTEPAAAAPAPVAPSSSSGGSLGNWWEAMSRQRAPGAPEPEPAPTTTARRAPPVARAPAPSRPAPAPRPSNRQSVTEAAIKSVIRSAGSQVGREIGRQLLRGVLGSLSRR
jgi:DNA helicase HerA-like ATPase